MFRPICGITAKVRYRVWALDQELITTANRILAAGGVKRGVHDPRYVILAHRSRHLVSAIMVLGKRVWSAACHVSLNR